MDEVSRLVGTDKSAPLNLGLEKKAELFWLSFTRIISPKASICHGNFVPKVLQLVKTTSKGQQAPEKSGNVINKRLSSLHPLKYKQDAT